MNRARAVVGMGMGLWLGSAGAACSEHAAPPPSMKVEGDAGRADCADASPAADASCTSRHDISGPQGSVRPRYFLARIYYAPLGTKFQPCLGASSVDYMGGSSLGTLLSIEASLVDGYEVVARDPVLTESNLATFAYSAEGAGLNIEKPASVAVKLAGSCQTDGIDHDSDLLEVWFNPTIDLTIGDGAISWTLDLSAPIEVMKLSVSVLKHPETLSQPVQAKLDAFGVSRQDLADILAQDPFVSSTPEAPDPRRFVPLKAALNPVPFEPSLPNAMGPTISFDVGKAPETEPFERATVSYTVSASIDGDDDFTRRLKAVLKDSDHWTWTSASHRETRRSDQLVAEIRAASPSPDYQGPGSLGVYYDAIYRGFTFVPQP